ncbi:MAG TPA: TonB-dependent receptor [Candidatus Acidoferrum sp.]|nr:TonB-dependent receptor [Candidatus Acidoferrum sp.]
MGNRIRIAIVLALLVACASRATIFGTVRGIVHDPQHRPIAGAAVTLKAKLSDWQQMQNTNNDGEFEFSAVPIGDYTVTVRHDSFKDQTQEVVVKSGTVPVAHFMLELAGTTQTVTVTGEPVVALADSVTPTSTLNREEIQATPGSVQTNNLSIITDYTPGAYVTHDQLHVRGGHQVSWLIDGVPVPNTNIASNVGPQFDPMDMDFLEIQRGSYDAEYGDRTYGVFNVLPRTGFERDRECDVRASFGSFFQTNDDVSCGGHTQRFAYYGSLNGNRSDLGLQTPTGEILHDAENGYGGFGSLIFNLDAKNQLRLVTSLRKDYYQIPNAPGVINEDQDSPETIITTPFPPGTFQADGEHESDTFVNFSWVHTFTPNVLMTISPLFHFNSADYSGNPNDFPLSTTDNRASTYVGGQAVFSALVARNNLEVGTYDFWQHDDQLFGILFNDGSATNFSDREIASGSLAEVFVEDKFQATSWLTLSGGVRQTHFSGNVTENATSPRLGVSIKIPKLNWVFRGFYGDFYQAPPLITASGPLLQFVNANDLGFIPLRGERDKEYQYGVAIPFKGWLLDIDSFRTHATNFFDHNNVGNSNIFFPLTITEALIRGWEATLRSPLILRRGHVHLAYSNQIALGAGAINGGLTDFSPPEGFFLLDHDQRNTLNVGFDWRLPWRSFAASNVYYGSGFSNGIAPPGPDHLSRHTTFDVSLGKDLGERFTISATALNVANRHLLIDNSLTFGGFHYNNPREIYGELRWRFHY